MKLALGTSWLVLALVSTWAAPTPVRQGATLVERLIGPEQTRVYDACINGQPSCLVARQNPNEPQLSEPSNTPASTNASLISSGSTPGTISTSTTSAPLSSTPESTSSLSAPDPFHFDELAAQSNPSNNSGDSDNNNLRTVGIVGGFLAGTALVAIIGIILILIRKQHNRGSSAASSFMSRRSRTRSSTRPPPAPMVTQPYSLPLTVPHPLRIHTGDGMTAASHDLTTAGTLGHQSTGMHMFPSVDVDPGSASSRTTSFGQHSSGTSSGGSNVPRRPPQIPSLGLSNPRPLMRSFGSLFSYHASTGHPTPTATRTALDREEHSEPEHTEVTAPSTFGSRTLAATEDLVRSDDHAQTEETGMSDDVTRTAETAHSGPVEASSDNQPKI